MPATHPEPPSFSPSVHRLLKLKEAKYPPEQFKQVLLRVLDRIERTIIRLQTMIYREAKHIDSADVRQLVDAIRRDERELVEMCIHRCDHEDPQISLDHDRVNNEGTLTLYERLSLATRFGLRPRLLFLHQMQRAICHRLKSLGINTSRN